MMKPKFRLNRMAAAVLLATASPLLTQVAHAGAGWGNSTNGAGVPIQVPTYYANSPSGMRADLSPGAAPGAMVDTGKPLRKFVDSLPGLTAAGANNLGQYVPLAVAEKWVDANGNATNDDYYEIGIVEYSEKMHSDLPKATTLRGYVQLATAKTPGTVALTYPDGSPILDAKGAQIYAVDKPHYLGPLIIAARGTPVRIKYSNLLPKGGFDPATGKRNGDLFLPVDKTLMGAGTGPKGGTETYTENRAEIHLHGGDNPWISDGTPHQWTTPAGEKTSYAKGASFANVPDMPDPGAGSGTLYYPNGDSGRLMFYHDHAAAITRLNVYAGEAAGYLLTDPSEATLPIPGDQIPLVIQERTYVPQDIAQQDAKWDTTHWGQPGDLWYPHVYEANQDPNSFDGTNPTGRWDYGPWFWPVFPAPLALPTGVWGDVTTVPEAFGDTPIVNGTAYPTATVQPQAYRLRILNASNDRMLNLGLYVAEPLSIGVTAGGSGYSATPTVVITPDPADTTASGATASATVVGGIITGVTVTNPGTGYTLAPSISFVDATGAGATALAAVNTEVKMIAAVPPTATMPLCSVVSTGTDPVTGLQLGAGVSCWPDLWPTDGRDGGVPDPTAAGPQMLQIGNEGGILPAPAVIPSTPVNYEYNRRSVTVLNVFTNGLYMGPAERADVVIDFSQFAGKTLILYNDSPAPVPAFDPRIDYYTVNPDHTAVGGAPSTLPGFGPNTRTIMQFKVANAAPAPAYNAAPLAAALQAAFAASQPKPVVAEMAYNGVMATPVTNNTYAKIFVGSATTPTFNFTTGDSVSYKPYNAATKTIGSTLKTVPAGTAVTDFPVLNKAIQELFDPNYGRMNATLGVELPFTSALVQTTIPLGYIDPVTEKIDDGETQIWKITNNGVDTHPVHFHLVNVQVINRIGWDGTLKPPAENELGWKETVKMNPLEDIVVAVRAKSPVTPFGVPNSVRALDPTQPLGVATGFTQVDPTTGNPAVVTNTMTNFGWEYVWHCHILGHEENDFMRPVVFNYQGLAPAAPSNLALAAGVLSWTDPTPAGVATTLGNPQNEIGFRVLQSVNGGAFATLNTALANQTSLTVPAIAPYTNYAFQVVAFNASGVSPASNTVTLVQIPAAPTSLSATNGAGLWVNLAWTAGSGNATSFQIMRDGVLLTTVAGNVSSFMDNTVALNTTYSYQVIAVNSAGNSAPSATVQVKTPNVLLAAPTALTAAYSAPTRSVALNWGDASTGETGYIVSRATVSVSGNSGAVTVGPYSRIPTPTTVMAPNLTAYTNANVNNNLLYSYQVAAVNGVTVGPQSQVFVVSAARERPMACKWPIARLPR